MPYLKLMGWPYVMVLIAVLSGCAGTGRQERTKLDISQILAGQAVAWNHGDIEEFMRPYWRSPDLTFSSGGQVSRGWKPVLDNYRKRYPDREAMGRLTFSDLEVSQPDRDVALVLGRWRLERNEPVGGAFTLVLRRIAGQWTIIHDHTSRDTPPDSSANSPG